jgi:lysophospholipid acyltransferase (LPLAT)-like uncharacterized protein
MKRLLPWLAAQVIRLITATLRVTTDDPGGVMHHPDHPPAILAFWHNRLFLMAPFYAHYCRGRTCVALISRSRDGQFIADVAAQFGVRAARGSSSKHGTSAALTALHAAKDERIDLCVTPDGPRGPRYVVQPGILRLAQTTGRPIVAIDFKLGWKKELKSWDRFQVPLPFSRCHLTSSRPLVVPPEADEEELAKLTERLREMLGD